MIWALAAVLIVAFFGVRALRAPVEVEVVAVASAYPYLGATLLNSTGYVVAQRKASVGSKASGRLVWLGVREGSRVKAGEVLARLESADVEAQAGQSTANVDVARAAREQAEAELFEAARLQRRADELARQHFVSVAALDEAEARLRRARAAVNSASAAIQAAAAAARASAVAVDQTRIRAPFDGVVLTKNANVGDVITTYSAAADSKGAVVTMADMGTLEVEADVSEAALAKVAIGQSCEIQLDALPDARFRGEVIRIVPTVDRSKASVMTKIRFLSPDPRILPEMSAKVAFLSHPMQETQRRSVVAVHKDALVRRGTRTVAYVVRDGHLREVRVETGAPIGDLVAVKGVAVGDTLVRKPGERIKDGLAVRIAQR
jgi:RND family efflux transporter MFP subunit